MDSSYSPTESRPPTFSRSYAYRKSQSPDMSHSHIELKDQQRLSLISNRSGVLGNNGNVSEGPGYRNKNRNNSSTSKNNDNNDDDSVEIEDIILKNFETNEVLEKKTYQLEEVRQQNSKLWCLVNKQREMIFELQKDLNGALKRIEKPGGGDSAAASDSSSRSRRPSSDGRRSLKVLTSFSGQSSSGGCGQASNSSPISPSLVSEETENGLVSPPSSLSPVEPHASFMERQVRRISGPMLPKSDKLRSSVLKRKKTPQEDASIVINEEYGNSQLEDLSSSILGELRTRNSTSASAASDPNNNNISILPNNTNELSTNKLQANVSSSREFTNLSDATEVHDEKHHATYNALPQVSRSTESDSDQNTITESLVYHHSVSDKPPSQLARYSNALEDDDGDSEPQSQAPTPPEKSPRLASIKIPSSVKHLSNNNRRASSSAAGSPTDTRYSDIDTFEGGTLDHGISMKDIKSITSGSDSSESSLTGSHGTRSNNTQDSVPEEFVCMNPKMLSSFRVVVVWSLIGKTSNSLRPAGMKENPIALFEVRSALNDKETWNILKGYQQFLDFDSSIRGEMEREKFDLPKLPEKSIFTGYAPVKVDMRRVFLTQYFNYLMCNTGLPSEVAKKLAHFLSVGVVSTITPVTSLNKRLSFPERNKYGYLTKRGRNLGGWKTRYFVLNGPYLNYYDRPDGDTVGTIVVANAGIGRQRVGDVTNLTYDENRQYRHALLIIEKKGDVKVSHVLCAESDTIRDQWVDALLAAVNFNTGEDKNISPLSINPWVVRGDIEDSSHNNNNTSSNTNSNNATTTMSTGTTTPFDKISGPINGYKILESPTQWKTNRSSTTTDNGDGNRYEFMDRMGRLSISTNAYSRRPSQATRFSTADPDGSRGGTLASEDLISPRQTSVLPPPARPSTGARTANLYSSAKKKPLFGFRSKVMGSSSSSSSDLNEAFEQDVSSRQHQDSTVFGDTSSDEDIRPRVFGVPLSMCVKFSSFQVDGRIVPSILYRTTEFLKVHDAHLETGIFRVNGSSSQIKLLASMFDEKLDVNLLEQDCDINVVCGLLKKWLIELPDPILTTKLELEFRIVMEIQDPELRRERIKELLLELPRENRDMIAVLCGYMALILEYQELNKMNKTNLGIIFSQTLKMPPSVFDGFLNDYHLIFEDHLDGVRE